MEPGNSVRVSEMENIDKDECNLKKSCQEYIKSIGKVGKMVNTCEPNPKTVGTYQKPLNLFNKNMGKLLKAQVQENDGVIAGKLGQKLNQFNNSKRLMDLENVEDNQGTRNKSASHSSNEMMEQSEGEELAFDESVNRDLCTSFSLCNKDPSNMTRDLEENNDKKRVQARLVQSLKCVENLTTILQSFENEEEEMYNDLNQYREQLTEEEKRNRSIADKQCALMVEKREAKLKIERNSKTIERLNGKLKRKLGNGVNECDGVEEIPQPVYPCTSHRQSLQELPENLPVGSFVASIPLRRLQSNEAAGSSLDTYY